MEGLQDVQFDEKELANLGTVSKMWGKLPHELALGRNDAPTYVVKPHPDNPKWFLVEPRSEIPMAHLIFDMQCANLYAKQRSQHMDDARKKAEREAKK